MKKKFTYLIATAALMIFSVAAMAQGGETPFLNSTHSYTVTMEDGANNTALWVIADGTGTPLATQPAFTTDVTGNTATMEITWATVGSFKVQFTETAQSTACVTAKELDVTVNTNDFDVSIGSLTDACNNNSGSISPADSATSIITIPFDMETGTTWGPNWEVTFYVAVTSSNARILSVALASGASGALSDLTGGAYSITNIASSGERI